MVNQKTIVSKDNKDIKMIRVALKVDPVEGEPGMPVWEVEVFTRPSLGKSWTNVFVPPKENMTEAQLAREKRKQQLQVVTSEAVQEAMKELVAKIVPVF